ncbi:unnamed protein product [Prorocentrum cordatum]|uniref:Uncharacterized protein n=1 Tax=Prorocentrum cordatum TaxID=2364126 RepID=A0ABN9V1Z0_9DINO|nr:unnamed protein product [Polarella glacialis]
MHACVCIYAHTFGGGVPRLCVSSQPSPYTQRASNFGAPGRCRGLSRVCRGAAASRASGTAAECLSMSPGAWARRRQLKWGSGAAHLLHKHVADSQHDACPRGPPRGPREANICSLVQAIFFCWPDSFLK